MKRFVFRLRALERWRASSRREAGGRLSRALGEVARLERESRERDAAAEGAAAGGPAPRGRPVDVREWKTLSDWCDGQRRIALELRDRARVNRQGVRELAVAYESAARNHRVVERLHERRRAEWRREAEREETRWLSENHLQRLAGRAGSEENRDDG